MVIVLACPHASTPDVCEACRYEEIRRNLILDPTQITRAATLVRNAARQMVGADGITFVIVEGDHVFYVEEDAAGPLWKGQRFPMELCVSGWVIRHGQRVSIPDVYADSRVHHPAYRTTFVQSMAMVPVGLTPAIGAVGAYWATRHEATEAELTTLQALADSAFLAMAV